VGEPLPHSLLHLSSCMTNLLHTGTAHARHTLEAGAARHPHAGVAPRHPGGTAAARRAAAPPALHADGLAHQTTRAAAGAAAGRLAVTGAARHRLAGAGRHELGGCCSCRGGIGVDGLAGRDCAVETSAAAGVGSSLAVVVCNP
jgi:hypothetical protein